MIRRKRHRRNEESLCERTTGVTPSIRVPDQLLPTDAFLNKTALAGERRLRMVSLSPSRNESEDTEKGRSRREEERRRYADALLCKLCGHAEGKS